MDPLFICIILARCYGCCGRGLYTLATPITKISKSKPPVSEIKNKMTHISPNIGSILLMSAFPSCTEFVWRMSRVYLPFASARYELPWVVHGSPVYIYSGNNLFGTGNDSDCLWTVPRGLILLLAARTDTPSYMAGQPGLFNVIIKLTAHVDVNEISDFYCYYTYPLVVCCC